jgi:hypothetical protein
MSKLDEILAFKKYKENQKEFIKELFLELIGDNITASSVTLWKEINNYRKDLIKKVEKL